MNIFEQLPAGVAVAAVLLVCGGAVAEPTPVPPAGATRAMTMTATVAPQMTVKVPDAIAFQVVDINSDTTATDPATIDVAAMALAPGAYLRISIVADAAMFTAPDGGTSWDAGDVTWVASTGTNYAGVSGTMDAGAPQETGHCAVGANVCATTNLVFKLKAKGGVAAGEHTLGAHWKFESLF